MSYLGRVTNKSSDIRRIDITSSTSATHTLTWTAPNEQSLIVTINGVKQQNNYTVSGTTLTLDTALISTDALEVIGINDIGTTITPAEGSVNTAQLANDSVTADKLANSINTDIAANTAKVTNATHTGDVTGATALTIATDAVDIAMLSATGTADATTFLRGDNAWTAVSGGLSHASMWDMTTDFTSDADPIASNWLEYPSHYGYARLGAAMTESSGLFTFPETGFWMIEFHLNWKVTNAENRYVNAKINTTTDNSTYIRACESRGNNYADSGSAVYGTTISKFIFDVTSVSTHKCSFSVAVEDNTTTTEGGGAGGAYPTGVTHHTFAVFIRLGDT